MPMRVDLAFFEGDALLCRGTVLIEATECTNTFSGSGHRFLVTHQFEEPAAPLTIACWRGSQRLYHGALRMGVHTSDDWESINLGNIHTLGFRCHVQPDGAA